MSCCSCNDREELKNIGKISSKIKSSPEPTKTVEIASPIESNLKFNYESYMTKKVFHEMPTIKEQYEEEEEVHFNRKTKSGITKKRKITLKEPNNKQYYELKEKLICIFCGGESCKHENWKLHPNPAIEGLNSDKITDNIFASQRLSNRLIKEYDLIKSFKQLNIGLVVNLQREGEHPYCGDKLDVESGFSYDPQILISEGIKCKNFGWEDMSIPESMTFMVEIVKEMAITIKEDKKKVLVHCHAGYGRTGIVIACYMISDSNKSAEEIVESIRSIRSKCIQKSAQMEFCAKFRNFIDSTRVVFKHHFQKVEFYIKNQNLLLFGEEVNRLKYVPKLLVEIVDRIIEIKKHYSLSNRKIYQDLYLLEFWDEEMENKICHYKREINNWNWTLIKTCDDLPLLVQLFYDWIEDSVISLIPAFKIKSVFDKFKEVEFQKYMENYSNIESRSRMNLILGVKSCFTMTEFESLLCLALLMSNIYPMVETEEELFFDRVLEKLLISVTGINPRKIKYNISEYQSIAERNLIPKDVLLLFNQFNTLMRFLSLYVKYDLQSKTFHNEIYHESVKSPSVITFNTLNRQIGVFQTNLNKNESAKSDFSYVKTDQAKDPLKIDDLKDKENVMYSIYLMLNKVFNNSGNLDDELNIEESRENNLNTLMIDRHNLKEKSQIVDIFDQFKQFLILKDPLGSGKKSQKNKSLFLRSKTASDFEKGEIRRKNSLLNKTQKMSVIVEEDIIEKYQSKLTKMSSIQEKENFQIGAKEIKEKTTNSNHKQEEVLLLDSNRNDNLIAVAMPKENKKKKLPSLYAKDEIEKKIESHRSRSEFGYSFMKGVKGRKLDHSIGKKI